MFFKTENKNTEYFYHCLFGMAEPGEYNIVEYQEQTHKYCEMLRNTLPILCTFVFLLFAIQGGNSESPSSTSGRNIFRDNTLFRFVKRKRTSQKSDKTEENMGQAVRIMKYDRAENERNAIPALTIDLLNQEAAPLKWHRLDDGVMGGQSESLHACTENGSLHFMGQINTNGGGFCSIRSSLPEGLPEDTTAIRLRFKGDGKTYKLLLSDGNRSTFGPSRRSPSWQCDIPTRKSDESEEITIPFSSFKPSFGPQPVSSETAEFDASSVREIGFMLSLQLSDGSRNPKKTFGSGIFPFSFHITSIYPVSGNQKGNE